MEKNNEFDEVKKKIDANSGKLVIEINSRHEYPQEAIQQALSKVREQIDVNKKTKENCEKNLESLEKDLQDLLKLDAAAKNWLEANPKKP